MRSASIRKKVKMMKAAPQHDSSEPVRKMAVVCPTDTECGTSSAMVPVLSQQEATMQKKGANN